MRLFHWGTVVLLTAAYVTQRLDWMGWHVLSGEALLALVLFRVGWGLVGSDTARFARFLAPPRAALAHIRHMFRREPDTQVGHNPAGGWMVLLFLALLLGETLSGVLVNNDVADDGPLTEVLPAPLLNAIADLHGLIWYALLAAVALHLAAIAVYALAKRHNLVWPMLTGWKRVAAAPPLLVPASRAVAVMAASALLAALAAARL